MMFSFLTMLVLSISPKECMIQCKQMASQIPPVTECPPNMVGERCKMFLEMNKDPEKKCLQACSKLK